MPTKVLFSKGDITDVSVDAIVSPADTDLTMEAGVAGVIRRKGGARLQEECERLAPLRVGAAAATTGGNLHALFVIHAASLRPGEPATAESVRLATRASLLRAEEKALRSIAFPALGTGAGGLALEECASTMLKVLLDHINVRTSLEKVLFVLFDDTALTVFEETYQKLTRRPAAKTA